MSGAFSTRPELSGTFGAVASTHWIATAVGMRTLELGGNAFDAAAAMGFVLQIVEPHLNGPGGDAPILACRAHGAEPTVICGQGPSPAGATIDHFNRLELELIPGTGQLAPCVPGAFGAWMVLLRDWGTLPLRAIIEPAIHYAMHGHPLLANAADTIESMRGLFVQHWRSSADVFLHSGKTPQAGSLFANPSLGKFYDRLLLHAEAASSARERQIEAALSFWYEGPVADAVHAFSTSMDVLDVSGRHHRGLLVADDLHGWRPPVERPLSVDHDDFKVFKCGPWSQGPVMLQCLRMLENDDLASMSPLEADYVHLVVEAIKLAMADRDAYYGDDPTVPIEHLLSKGYASARRALITPMASQSIVPGRIDGHRGFLPAVSAQAAMQSQGNLGAGEPTTGSQAGSAPSQNGDTCHIDVIDRWGNMVSATPSGGWLQSNPIIPALGFALGSRMQMFWLNREHPNGLMPRKRPRTTLTPSMAFRNGAPYLAFGTPGGDQQEQWSLQLFLSHAHHGTPLQAGIDAPAMHTEHLISSFWPRKRVPGSLIVESRYSEATIRELRQRGHQVTVGGPWSEGRLSACARDVADGRTILRAGANPRGMQGYALVR
ncbi:MAG: gamma-glutamyltransferase family protein [Pseudomonadota bacterium]|nr:gamma-glutamyltransferase family protein [Pseudomonadota bacterium]